MKKSSIIGYSVLTILLAVSVLTYLNLQGISDWWTLRSYEPNTSIAALATNSGMSEEGRRIFYLGDPVINDKGSFNENCPFPERTLVLGCYDGSNIFILRVDEKRLEGAEEVTAAHEMLHAVYQRMTNDERNEIDKLLVEQLRQVKNPRILKLVKEYQDNDPQSLANEIHSILPTEYRDLSPELEEHYSQFFDDRDEVVALAEDYAKVFTDLENEIKRVDARLESLKSSVDNQEQNLAGELAALEALRSELDTLLRNDQIAAYNSLVPEFNAQVASYNDYVSRLKSDIQQYNSLIARRNRTAVAQNKLIESLDSEFQEVKR